MTPHSPLAIAPRNRAAHALRLLLLAAPLVGQAAGIVWNGSGDRNWSEIGNWDGGLPTPSDDVSFFDAGTANNTVDAGSSGTIGSLRYGNTNGFHTTLIASGTTLNVTGAGGLYVGTGTTVGSVQSVLATIVGTGGRLNIDNPSANLLVGQGNLSGSSASLKATLDLSGLDTFTATVGRFGIGGRTTFAGQEDRQSGVVYLARTNVVTIPSEPVSYLTLPVAYPLVLGDNDGNTGGTLSRLYLGVDTTFFVDGLAVGTMKCGGGANPTAGGWLGFNPAFVSENPKAVFRGTNGMDSRVTLWTAGNGNSAGNSSNGAVGTNDFTGGMIDVLVDSLVLGRDRGASSSKTFPFTGTFAFNAGTVDANTVILGNQISPDAANPSRGVMNMGANATLVVNTVLELGHTDGSSNGTFGLNAATNTTGILTVSGGTVRAASITSGTLSAANPITITGGRLAVTGTVAPAAAVNIDLALTNATLELTVATGRTNIVARNLALSGTLTVDIAAAPAFSAYPVAVPLVRYEGSVAGGGYTLALGTVPETVSGYLTNNADNHQIELVLVTAPFPVITTSPSSASAAPDEAASFTVASTGVAPISHRWWKDGLALSDTANVTGTTTPTLSVSAAENFDAGLYSVVLSNSYGSVTSAVAVLVVSSGSVAPIITGPSSLVAVQGQNATFTASVAGIPAPTILWLKNGSVIDSETSSSLTISAAQYPDDQATYAIVASNTAGSTTNHATLTVQVPPGIGQQPADLTVAHNSPATFTVVATGVPDPSYQWKKGGVAIDGETAATYTIPSAQPTNAGIYSVTVSNPAGSTNSVSVTLLVNSSMSATNLWPANNATGVNVDTPLAITFDQAPSIGGAGRILVYDAANPGTPVDTIDLGTALQTKTIGGVGYKYRPVLVEGSTAYLSLHTQLQYGATYFVVVENVPGGVFKDGLGLTFSGITDTNRWRFTTKAAAPEAGATNLVVAADGSGDYDTVQGAVDFVPSGNTTPTTIHVRNGVYREIVFVNTKHNLTVLGEGRAKTIITYANNDNLNAGTAVRCMFRFRGNDGALLNLTLTNSTPQGGSQAESLRVDGVRFIAQNVDFYSLQDTILVNNSGDQAYFQDCLVQGNVDYVWGIATMYFTNCEMRTVNRGGTPNGYMAQPRTDAGHNGIAWVNCRLTGTDNAITTQYLARTGGDTYPYTSAAYINCSMGTLIPAVGWDSGGMTDFSHLRFWEYRSTALDGVTPIDVSGRASFAKQLAPEEAASVIDPAAWFGGWNPQLPPYISQQPAGQSANQGASVTLTVGGQGVRPPVYQWLKNGEPLPNETNAALAFASVLPGNAGSYSVIVSNAAGTVASAEAVLTVTTVANAKPTLNAIPNTEIDPGIALSVTNVATDSDLPAQTLTFTLLVGPSNASLDGASGLLTWRPLVTQADSSHPFTVVVADNGSPSLGATQSFSVVVHALTKPTLSGLDFTEGAIGFNFNGAAGLDYAVQTTTNLTDWTTVFTTNSAPSSFAWRDTSATTPPYGFYRILVGPPLP